MISATANVRLFRRRDCFTRRPRHSKAPMPAQTHHRAEPRHRLAGRYARQNLTARRLARPRPTVPESYAARFHSGRPHAIATTCAPTATPAQRSDPQSQVGKNQDHTCGIRVVAEKLRTGRPQQSGKVPSGRIGKRSGLDCCSRQLLPRTTASVIATLPSEFALCFPRRRFSER